MLHYVKDMINLEKLIERKVVDTASSIEDVVEAVDNFFETVDVESDSDIVSHRYGQEAWLDFNNSLIMGIDIGQKFTGMNSEERIQFERACHDSLKVWLHLCCKMDESMSRTTITVTDEGLEIEAPLFTMPIASRRTAKTEAAIRYHLLREGISKEGPYPVKNEWYSVVADMENLDSLLNNPDPLKLDGRLTIERRDGIFYGKMKVYPFSPVFEKVVKRKCLEPFIFSFGSKVDERDYRVADLCFFMKSYDGPYPLRVLKDLGVSVDINFTIDEEESDDNTQETSSHLS